MVFGAYLLALAQVIPDNSPYRYLAGELQFSKVSPDFCFSPYFLPFFELRHT